MNSITLEQLKQTTLSTDYFNRIIEESIKIAKLEELRADVGEELFNQLSEEDKYFIIETEGIVYLGYEASDEDLKRIYERIEE